MLSDEQIKEFKKLLDGEGMGLSAIGSPVGKVAIDADFNQHLDKLKRAIDLCDVFGTKGIRIFSYYPPGNDANFDPANWPKYRDEVIRRMSARRNWPRKATWCCSTRMSTAFTAIRRTASRTFSAR